MKPREAGSTMSVRALWGVDFICPNPSLESAQQHKAETLSHQV